MEARNPPDAGIHEFFTQGFASMSKFPGKLGRIAARSAG
jgi:hypothetical protein